MCAGVTGTAGPQWLRSDRVAHAKQEVEGQPLGPNGTLEVTRKHPWAFRCPCTLLPWPSP